MVPFVKNNYGIVLRKTQDDNSVKDACLPAGSVTEILFLPYSFGKKNCSEQPGAASAHAIKVVLQLNTDTKKDGCQ